MKRPRRLWSQDEFERELRRVMRRAARLQAVAVGDASVETRWRNPYKEKKIRSYRGHWVHVVKLNKPVKVATRAAKTIH